MDLDEDTEVKSPEPQAQPGERPEASDWRGLLPPTSPQSPRPEAPRGGGPAMPPRPLSGVLAQEYGGGRRQQVQGERGRVWHKARGGETEASGNLEVSAVGREGCTDYRVPQDGVGEGQWVTALSQRFKPEAPGRRRALSARSGGQLPPRGRQGHRCGHLSFSPSRESVQERLGSGSPGGPGESAQQGGQRGVCGRGEGTRTS